MQELQKDYPWVVAPLVACAPMRLIALAELAVATSAAGGLGFIGAGSDVSLLGEELDKARSLLASLPGPLAEVDDVLAIGVGFLCWGLEPEQVTRVISAAGRRPSAVWLFAPREASHLERWSDEIRRATGGRTKIWVQVGTVAEALETIWHARPDVLVVQGQDAGGHGLERGAGLVALLPEVRAAASRFCEGKGLAVPRCVAAGGIAEGAGAAAALALGAQGVCLGTRFLAAREANVAIGYRDAVLRSSDGGVSTARSKVYDTLRGTTEWPAQYGGRGVVNASYEDWEKGMSVEENKKLYEEAMGKGDEGWSESGGRMTAYAGTGVGLVDREQSAAEVVREVRRGAVRRLQEVVGEVQGCV